ncbi:hypothetical protein NBO_7g0048 [Nosema bombycis CQ1]|uniref:Uncharacterized protein n=1 Tax=Nosema bombycis (strain CQ1 / CVCC 102059) TaxID=578461 RepID=R0MLV1_NOSB1|nr:hypothetical protein NBO_7g0048 [Nosema bombycis CQ1]|eukprot:EOB15230.1 hypothetical protein NBO_7g0048 [Nosema bombycis CQ1]
MFNHTNLFLCIHFITILTTTAETTRTQKDINRRGRPDPSEYGAKPRQGYKTSKSMSAEELMEKIDELNDLINESMEKIEDYNESLRQLTPRKKERGGWEEKKFSTKPYKQALKNDLKSLGAKALNSFNLKYSKPKERRRRYYD